MGDGFYRSKDPTNSIEVLKEKGTETTISLSCTLYHITWPDYFSDPLLHTTTSTLSCSLVYRHNWLIMRFY